jgi:hypothetical protein
MCAILICAGGLTKVNAQVNCQPGAFTGDKVNEGQGILILEFDPNDLYYEERKELMQDTFWVSGNLTRQKDCLFSGNARGKNGKLYSFSRIQIKLASKVVDAPPDCKPGASFGVVIPPETEVELLAIHGSDIYALIHPDLVGERMRTKTSLKPLDGCWYEGQLTDDQKNAYVFFKIQVKTGISGFEGQQKGLAKKDNLLIKDGFFADPILPKGTQVVILDIASNDIFYPNRAIIIGKSGKSTEDLKSLGNGWYSGNIMSSEGTSYLFFKVRLGPK